MKHRIVIAFVTGAIAVTICRASAENAPEAARDIVVQIQQADYEGNQAALRKLYDQLAPFLQDRQLACRVRYWRAFAMWRRAINGFNDAVDPVELGQDLDTAITEFKAALAVEPAWVEAKVGLVSCLGYLAYMQAANRDRVTQLLNQIFPLVKDLKETAPDNPRFLWVLGPILWNSPPERGGGQEKAIDNYERALKLCSTIKPGDDPLKPSWGRPELMMSLAYSYLNKALPDINAAEDNARAALAIVPNWHYVRDILLPQILRRNN